MKFFFILLLCPIFCGFLPAEQPYQLTVCTIFHNDAKWLPEWIEFHEKQGVEHFYLYNHGSTDDYLNILQPYVERGIVELIDWMYATYNIVDFASIQSSAYTHCLKRIVDETKWCAILDTDEFLFSVDGRMLTEALKDYDSYSGVVVNWVCYGTSGIEKIPADKKMIETLFLRAPMDFPDNYFVKSIVKPQDVSGCGSAHFCKFKPGKYCVTENKTLTGLSMQTKQASVKKLRINHYWSRDLDFFYNVKIDRWIKWGMPYTYSIEKEAKMNEEFDDIILSIPH